MVQIDFTSILLGIMTLLGGCAWFVNFRKDKQEAKGLKTENEKKEMELSKMYVDEVYKNVLVPLQGRVQKMENKLEKLEDAVHSIYKCPHHAKCPVLERMRKQSEGDEL